MTNALGIADIKAIFSRLEGMAEANKDTFTKLDSEMGDGDLGLTMSKVFRAAREAVDATEKTDLGAILAEAGAVMAKAAPSTMGTLLATGFMRGGKALRGKATIGLAEFSDFWTAFAGGLVDRGKARPGEKTIVDALAPAAEAVAAIHRAGGDLGAAAEAARAAAAAGVEATRDMVAQHGRAAYFGEKSRAFPDPGATVGADIVATFADHISGA